MKKIYFLFFTTLWLLSNTVGFSQATKPVFELSPARTITDSRFSVVATVMDDDTWCQVTWPDAAMNHSEIWYDDGEADDYFLFTNPGSMNANKFSPTFYPFIVTGGRIYVGDGTFPGPFLGTSFGVFVLDDDGIDGFPGTILDSMTVAVSNYGWVEFEGMTASITEGDFYLAMKQTAPSPNTAPVGVDMDNPTYIVSYTKYNNNAWVTAPLQDFMIRAWVTGYDEKNRNIDYYRIDRFSGFDPDGSPLLGETTILDTLTGPEYNDYDWDELPPGWFAYGLKTHFTGGNWSEYDVSNVVSHSLIFYPPMCFYQLNGGDLPMIMCPPLDSTGAVPSLFIGYNLYVDSVLYIFLPASTTSYDPAWPSPANIMFQLTAVYDLTSLGYPGELGESDGISANYYLRYGVPLDFLEEWTTGSFETNAWTREGENWTINSQAGSPSPAAEFTHDPVQANYSMDLESYPFLADTVTEWKIYLDFDIKLVSAMATGSEFLLVQVWNWENLDWTTFRTYSNVDGSFNWTFDQINITPIAMGQVFKVRFSARGENSNNIVSWFVDNIHVYQMCPEPLNLWVQANSQGQGLELNWDQSLYNPIDEWIEWDDGVNDGNSIGTGSEIEFDVAARWEPEHLVDFAGGSVTEIGFFPAEAAATYKVRVWSGELAEDLIIDQLVVNPVMDQWNYIPIDSPVPIDITRDLYVGYYVYTTGGYPAGVDNGPAIDGFGNMMNFGGWQTLLEINPELSYNWNISAHIQNAKGNLRKPEGFLKYAIYRQDDWNDYLLRGYSDDEYYLDDSAICETTNSHFYYVTALYSSDIDFCESPPSNEDGIVCEIVNEDLHAVNLEILPNPAHDLMKIKSSEKIDVISIYDSHGQRVFSEEEDDNSGVISVSDFPPGLYLVKVLISGEVVSRKVLIIY